MVSGELMLKKELNRLEVSLDKPYMMHIPSLAKGLYVLRIIHQNEAVFKRPRSLFFTFSIKGNSPREVKSLLSLQDVSNQNGAFIYAGEGYEESGYFVKEIILNVVENILELDINLRTFLPYINICIDALQLYNTGTPRVLLFGNDPSNILFFKEGAESLINNEEQEVYFRQIVKYSCDSFIINDNTEKKLLFRDVIRGKYVVRVFHKNTMVFDRSKSIFISFTVPEKTDEDVRDILGLKDVSSQYGAFSYLGGGNINDIGYQQELILNVIEPIDTLAISLRSFIKTDILIDYWILEKLPEEDKVCNSRSIVTKSYPQYWVTSIEDKDNFVFEERFTDLGQSRLESLGKEGRTCKISVCDVDTLTVRLNLTAQNNSHIEKQAILTIDYLDEHNNSLNADINSPYSAKFKKYYYYLTVDAAYNNNVHLELPKGTTAVELSTQLWDNQSDIMFDGRFSIAIHKPGISIIIPSYKGENTILRCLDSLYNQSLAASMFEVIIALNGERDSTRERIEHYQAMHPEFNMIILELDIASASYARNEALKKVKFSYVTFVDDDDYVDKNYLLHLYEKASWNTIVLTGVNDILDESGRLQVSSILTQLSKASEKDIITYQDVTSLLTMNACKLAPVHMVKSIAYNKKLKSGEDVVYWSQLLSLFTPLLELSNNFERAVYYRVITDNSVSRQQESYDFNVKQRLDVIADLITILNRYQNNISLKNQTLFIQSKINAQSLFIKRYLERNECYYPDFQKEIADRKLSNSFINKVNECFTKRLVISYCFAPYADTSAVVMSKRINQMTAPVDVISNSMSNVRTKDESLNKIASFNIGKHIELNAPQSFANWDAMVSFSEMVVRRVGEIISKRGMYQEIYSRAMWPASHFAAALIKKKFPHVKWLAEFSDPLLMDVTANERYESLSVEWLKMHGLVNDKITELSDNLFYWCEKLVYDFADEIIFTNENQQNYMISYADIPESTIKNKSKILPQPTLSDKYYNLSNLKLNKQDDNIYIGYFGSFYINRGFDAFFEAWDNLAPKIKSKIRLHVYTQQDQEIVLEKAPAGIREYIVIAPYVEYFDFLSLSKQFDVLLVVDAMTEGFKANNPYLPSKISDYLGSENTVLAFVEDGSPMSQINSKTLYKVGLNNLNEITHFMEGHFIK